MQTHFPIRRALRLTHLPAALCAAWLAAMPPTATGQVPPDLRRTRLFCDASLALCLVSSPDRDSDGDGYSDADEKAAGTDPTDPGSRPTIQVMLQRLAEHRLPSAALGRLILLAPPTQTPQGLTIQGIGAGAYLAGFKGFPARAAVLASLGLDSSVISAAGIDPRAGFVLRPGGHPGGGITLTGNGGMSFGLLKLRLGQIAAPAGANPLGLVQGFNQALGMLPSVTGAVVSVGADPLTGRIQVSHKGGVVSMMDFKNSEVANGSTHQSTVVIVDGAGRQVGDGTVKVQSSPGANGTKNHYAEATYHTTGADGTRTDSNFSVADTLKMDGAKDTNSKLTETITRPDGSSTTTSVNTTIKDDLDGAEKKTVETVVTEKDKDGKVVSTVTTTTTTVTDGKTTTTNTKVTCTGKAEANCPQGYVNGDAVFDTVVLSADEARRIVELLHSKTTKSGSTLLQHLSPGDLKDPKDLSPVVYIDHDGRLQLLATPTGLWNTNSGTQNTGNTGLPSPTELPPGQTPQDKTLSKLVTEAMPGLPAGQGAIPWPR